MHPELKNLIASLPKLITTEFKRHVSAHNKQSPFPLTVPALFGIVRAECMAQVGGYAHDLQGLTQVRDTLNTCYTVYAGADSNKNLSLLLESVRSVLVKIDPELQVALFALLTKGSESDMINMLGKHYSNNMDQKLPIYVQYAVHWHRNWCSSNLPAGVQGGGYKYPHTEVPVLTFMHSIADIASGNKADVSLPWSKEINVVVHSKLEWLSPTETEILRIIAGRLTNRDIENDFIKYFG